MEVSRVIRAFAGLAAALAAVPGLAVAADIGVAPDTGLDAGPTAPRDAGMPSGRTRDAGTSLAPTTADTAPSPPPSDVSPNALDAGRDALPSSPDARLDRAERAFRKGRFARIPPLLAPVVEPEPSFDAEPDIVRARELLGVGLFFTARQQTLESRRRQHLEKRARKQFLALLKLRPDHELDPLIYPESVVDLFQTVRDKHADTLERSAADRRAQSGDTGSRDGRSRSSASTLYIERRVVENYFWFNLLPGAVGQFQNDELLKGQLLLAGQLGTVVFNLAAFLQLRLLDAKPGDDEALGWDGRFCTRRDGCDNYRNALGWRRAQYVAWALFGGLYVTSVVDGILNFQPTEVDIRTLDDPPPELSERGGGSSRGPVVRIGLGTFSIRW